MVKLLQFFTLKILILAVIILVLIIIAVFIYYFYFANYWDNLSDVAGDNNITGQESQGSFGCKMEERPLKISGNSLSGLIESGAEMKVLMGYYGCNEVKRGDIALYSYSPERNPLIKIVKGIPGDKFELKKTPAGCWNLLINAEIAENFQNQQYCLNDQGYKMISLYVDDYNGIIPGNTYLIMGNLVGGSMDSSRFGLIGKQDLVGKAIGG